MQTNTLCGKKQLLIGFTLFSMFFGAGNLIFPPYLGAQAGTAPLAGLCRVCRQRHRPAHRGRGGGGPGRAVCPQLAGRVAPPLRAGVRCAGLSRPSVPASPSPARPAPRLRCWTPLAGRKHRADSAATPSCSLLRRTSGGPASPKKLTQRLGRILCPALLVLIVVLFTGCHPPPGRSPATARLPRLTPPSPPHRACWTAIRPWTRWQRSISAQSSL